MKENNHKKIWTWLTVCVLLAAVVGAGAAGCGSDAQASQGPLDLTQTDNGKTFTVKVGDTITVTIPGNVTTGYQWTAALSDKDAALLKAVGEPAYVEESADEQLVGAGGTYTFTFTAAAEGKAELKLIYWRSFEPDVDPIDTFVATVTIEK